MTFVEVMIALVILCVGVLGVLSSSTLGLKQATRARDDIKYWGDVQQLVDSLTLKGWNNVVSGSATIRGRAVAWTVNAAGSNPQQITLVANSYLYRSTLIGTQDTVIVYLARPGTWAY
jgi:hypothetical protein